MKTTSSIERVSRQCTDVQKQLPKMFIQNSTRNYIIFRKPDHITITLKILFNLLQTTYSYYKSTYYTQNIKKFHSIQF